jgi:hypothetical protein
MPFLISGYFRRLIIDLKQNLEQCVGQQVKDLIDELPYGDDDLEKLAAIISIEENKAYLDKIISAISDNPLLINRISCMTKELTSPKKIESALNEHEQRVEWHIQRIYRMRNMVAHSMERLTPYYMATLIENLHAYVDLILESILITSIENPGISTMDEIILKMSIDAKVHKEFLKKNQAEKCTRDNYLLCLFGL